MEPVEAPWLNRAVSQDCLMQPKDLRGNPKPRVFPDRTGPKPVRGRGTVLRIFRVGPGRGILFWVGAGQGIFFFFFFYRV